VQCLNVENYLPIIEHNQRYTSFVVSVFVQKTARRGWGRAFWREALFKFWPIEGVLIWREVLIRGREGNEGLFVRDWVVRDGYGLAAWVLVEYTDNGGRTWVREKLRRAQARCRALFTQCQRYRVVVSRQSDCKSARNLIDLQISCLLHCWSNS